jgi:hypothetical protein
MLMAGRITFQIPFSSIIALMRFVSSSSGAEHHSPDFAIKPFALAASMF